MCRQNNISLSIDYNEPAACKTAQGPQLKQLRYINSDDVKTTTTTNS